MRIAYLCDGTWNDPSTNTNVYRLSTATLQIAGEQDCGYDNGVGTDGNPIDMLFGGALGAGLVNKVKAGYTQIAHLYEAADDIFLFGFSRGAYTARCLAGMIAICGLPTKNVDDECVDTAWQAYRDATMRQELLASLTSYSMYDAKICMLGVWDTVGALGIPALWGGIDTNQYGFLDTTLHPDVLNAFQCLALDEQRAQFPPTLWTSSFAPGQIVEQLWFTGVHCDIGGGYSPSDGDNNTRLADITLSWMASKAQALGLKLDPSFTAQYQAPVSSRYALDQIHNSHTGIFILTPPKPRVVQDDAVLSNSVAIRCQYASLYAPGNLTLAGGIPSNQYGASAVVGKPPIPDW